MSKDVKRWLTLFAVLGVAGTGLVWFTYFRGRAFDPIAWHDPVQVNEGVRQDMADRLVLRRTLIGKTRPEIVEMLGEPDSVGPRNGMRYYIGLERDHFFRIDPESLCLRLDDDGRVISSYVGKW
jgi:hypothetical protein